MAVNQQLPESMMIGRTMRGNVINIQKYTVHDGPGIRTEVFLKGCPLRCLWCSNPESMKAQPEVGVNGGQCIGIDKCGWCIEACKQGALLVNQDNKVVAIDRTRCINCCACAKACCNDTLHLYGKSYTVDEIMDIIEDDRKFYDRTGGGVTFSGGDALVQWEFVKEVFKRCKKKGIHTCLESELHCKREVIDEILPVTDMIISDIKHMDTKKHKEYTGVGNETILENLRYLSTKNVPIVLRIPVIPGHNDSEENLRATGEFILNDMKNQVRQLQLLPYRPMGIEKYDSLSMPYPMRGIEMPDSSVYVPKIKKIAEDLQAMGVAARPGTTFYIL